MIAALYTLAMLELFLGGGGRLMPLGPMTVRMVLFVPCTFIGLFALVVRRRITHGQMLAVLFMLAYLLVHLSALMNGFVRGFDSTEMLKEFQQSLYWLAGPFFALLLESEKMVRRTAVLAQVSGVILGIAYLGLLIAGALGLVNLLALFMLLRDSGELVSRGEGIFVYKGFLYLGVALVFLMALRGRYWKSLSVLIAAALVMTLTRGFILATGAAVLLLLLVQRRTREVLVGVAVALTAVFLVWVYLPSSSGSVQANREISNGQRIADAMYVVDHASPITFLFGEGYGSLINERENVENTFLWAFWKLGLAGVLFWLAPLGVCTYYFLHIPQGKRYQLACGYYFSVVFVYVQTMTNPFLNNPIGQSFVMAAMLSLQTLLAAQRSQLAEDRGAAPLGASSA